MKTKLFAAAVLLVVLFAALGLTALFLSAPNEGEIRVACVGDSITEGSNYVADLSKQLGGNYSVGNFGVGLASVSLATTKPYMNQPVFSQAKDFEPDKVVIMLGTNDAITWYQPNIGNFSSDYKQLIKSFQELPSKPQIYLVVPPPIFNDSLGPNSTILVEQIIPQIRQIAAETGLPLIDFYDEMEAHPEYSSDGVHLTVAGSRFVADKIFEDIKRPVNVRFSTY
ncbi:MAG: GDSL-type esterase/lipase family protein [Candidatus Bathyarchaeia archaeon]|jgi:lysophospholipase L1-like esterase